MSRSSVPLGLAGALYRAGGSWRSIAIVINARTGANFQPYGVRQAIKRAQAKGDSRFPSRPSRHKSEANPRVVAWFCFCRATRQTMRKERMQRHVA